MREIVIKCFRLCSPPNRSISCLISCVEPRGIDRLPGLWGRRAGGRAGPSAAGTPRLLVPAHFMQRPSDLLPYETGLSLSALRSLAMQAAIGPSDMEVAIALELADSH